MTRRDDPQDWPSRVKFIARRHGILVALISTMPFWWPLVEDYLVTSRMMEEYRAIVRYELHRYHSSRNQVDDQTLIQVMRLALAKQSIHKVDWLKGALEGRDLKDPVEQRRIRQDIENEFVRQSANYIHFLNRFRHPHIGSVGDYVSRTFEMESFLNTVYGLVLNNGDDVNLIADDVFRFMLKAQDRYFTQIVSDLQS